MKTDRLMFLAITLLILAPLSLAARRADSIIKHSSPTLAPQALTTTDLTQGATPASMVTALLGPGVTAENVTYNGAPLAAGTFIGGTGIVGFESGIVLSSGCISNLVGPNVSDSISCDLVLPGDPDLTLLSGFTTFDATVLEFDFEPADPNGTTLLFSYVFTSDEYNEFVTTQYNDAFAFFVNGQNCALVPGVEGSPYPVTINTVNNGNPYGSGNDTNPLLYLNNDLEDGGGAIDTEMDGLTVVLTCQAAIIPNATNHIKLAIADASDGIYDSNVLIRSGSLTPTDLVISLDPPSATNVVGTTHTVTATVTNNLGEPQPGHEIRFQVISGPNTGATGTCSSHVNCETDDAGHVSFTYTGGVNEGTDVIQGCFEDAGGNWNCSAGVTKRWVLHCGPDGAPCRPVPGPCDVQDTCLDDLCHHNGYKPATTECRYAAAVCDLPEFCTGASPNCPLDQHAPDGTPCSDGNICTTADACSAGSCGGTPVPPTAEVDDAVRIDKASGVALLSWNPAPGATVSDIVRGSTSSLPVGSDSVQESCLASRLTGTRLVITADPAAGSGFWYLVRGVSACGIGPYGYQAENGVPTVPRVTTACP